MEPEKINKYLNVIRNLLVKYRKETLSELITKKAEFDRSYASRNVEIEMYRKYNSDDCGGWTSSEPKPYENKYLSSEIDMLKKNLQIVDEAEDFLFKEILNKYFPTKPTE